MRRGWYGESYRHYLAAKHIKTKSEYRHDWMDRLGVKQVTPEVIQKARDQRLKDLAEGEKEKRSYSSTKVCLACNARYEVPLHVALLTKGSPNCPVCGSKGSLDYVGAKDDNAPSAHLARKFKYGIFSERGVALEGGFNDIDDAKAEAQTLLEIAPHHPVSIETYDSGVAGYEARKEDLLESPELPARSVYDIDKLTKDNSDYRKVISTNPNEQVVLMSIPPKGDVGMEVHPRTDQFFRVERGSGEAILNGRVSEIKDGFAFTVPQGTEHDVVNTGKKALKLYTVYAPPHHKPGIIRHTKQDAERIPE